jgi:hypothetical protein
MKTGQEKKDTNWEDPRIVYYTAILSDVKNTDYLQTQYF